MEEKIDKSREFKDRSLVLFKENKKKILISFLILFAISLSAIFLNYNKQKKNNLIAEKYIKANLYFSANRKEKSKEIYEEIIFSNNKFYSVLSLYAILEKELETDKNKILEYFENAEKLDKSDILVLKKALFLIKNSEINKGNELLKKIIDNNSKFKSLAEEILSK